MYKRNFLLALETLKPRLTLDHEGDRFTERQIVHGCECWSFDTWLEGLEIALQYFVWNNMFSKALFKVVENALDIDQLKEMLSDIK